MHGSRFTALACLTLLVLYVTHAGAQELPTDPGLPADPEVLTAVTLDNPVVTVIDKATGAAKIEATGKLSLAKGDTYESFKVEYFDPNNKSVTPSIVQFKAPAAGTTENFKFTHTISPPPALSGKWQIQATYYYKTGAIPGIKTDSKSATVP